MDAADSGAASAALALWRTVFAGGEGYLCVASGERNVSSKLGDFRERYFRWPEEADEAAFWCAQQSEAGAETYFCAHLLNVAQRRAKNAAPVRALWADGDGATFRRAPGALRHRREQPRTDPMVLAAYAPGRAESRRATQ